MRGLVFGGAALALSASFGCGSSVSSGAGGSPATSTHSASSGSGGQPSDGGVSCPIPADPQSYETGTGETCFARLTAGQTVPVMQGPQGGFHLWFAFGCADCGAQAIVEYGVKDPATKTWYAGTAPSKAVALLDGAKWAQRGGFTSFLPGVAWDPKSQLPKGTHVILAGSVLAGDGSTLHEAEIEVVLGDVQQWNPPCDPDPMTCGQPGSLACCSKGGSL